MIEVGFYVGVFEVVEYLLWLGLLFGWVFCLFGDLCLFLGGNSRVGAFSIGEEGVCL